MFQILRLALVIFGLLEIHNKMAETKTLQSKLRDRHESSFVSQMMRPSVNNLGAKSDSSEEENSERGWRTVLDYRYYGNGSSADS